MNSLAASNKTFANQTPTISYSEAQRYTSHLKEALKVAKEHGRTPRFTPRHLKPFLLAYLKRKQMERGQKHSRLLRPSRIAVWLQVSYGRGHHHHISPYSTHSLEEPQHCTGSLHEAGREFAQLPLPGLWRDCRGNRCPAQSHPCKIHKTDSSSESSLPIRPKVGKENEASEAWLLDWHVRKLKGIGAQNIGGNIETSNGGGKGYLERTSR